jgi:predicted Zn finger-like uncharacterized protein
MNVTCPNCASVYRVDPAKVPESGVRARCAVCSAVFAVRKDGEQSRTPPSPAVEPTRQPTVAPQVQATPEPKIPPLPEPKSEPARPAAAAAAPAPRAPEPMKNPFAAAPSVATPAPAAVSGRPSAPASSAPPAAPSRPAAPPRPATPGTARPGGAQAPAPSAPSTAQSSPVAAPPPATPKAPATPAAPVPSSSPPKSSAPAPAPPTAKPPAGGRPANPFLSQDPALKARRLARALISDMVVYHPGKRQEGLRDGNLKDLFEEEIKKSWEEYAEQVGRELAESTAYFREALNEILAGGRQIF